MSTTSTASEIQMPLLDTTSIAALESLRENGSNPFAIPYHTALSFELLIARIKEIASSGHGGQKFLAQEVLARIDKHPEMLEASESPLFEDAAKELMEIMMTFLFPAVLNRLLFRISLPFGFLPIYSSPSLTELMASEDVYFTMGKFASSLQSLNLVHAGLLILERCYGKEVPFNPVSLLKTTDKETGQIRYLRPTMNKEFIKVSVNGPLPPLNDQDFHKLLKTPYDRDLWLSLLPPDVFSFEGFMYGVLQEVSRDEALSQLKHKLLHREAVLDINKVKELADLVRLFLNLPDLQLGLTAIDYPSELAVNHCYKTHFYLLANEVADLTATEYNGSIYHRAFETKATVRVEDLTEIENPTKLEQLLIDKGIRSVIIAPLMNSNENTIGLVELGSPKPYELNAFTESEFQELQSMFRMTVARSRDDVDNQLEAILREQYTSLHPSIEWRFMEEAYKILEQRSAGKEIIPGTVVFEDIYPLYGQADIVGSSKLRNEAILADLQTTLLAAKEVLVVALNLLDFPLARQVILELDQALAIKSDDFNNSHETSIVELILQEINPFIRLLINEHSQLKLIGQRYLDSLNPDLGLIYDKRKDYETSVSQLNKMIGRFFEQRDKLSQNTIPHYFEQYRTDGVEYEVYLGQSLLQHQKFNQIHLRNLRLSQLVDMAELTREIAILCPKLPSPIKTAQLIFAYTSSLNFIFRMDEKRLDVDGAYNVRYEILKKRIDKATINNGKERLTKAGYIVIVYLHDRDRIEYQNYLEYLINSGYVDGKVEDLTLDPLQSVQGLKAFRFRVKV